MFVMCQVSAPAVFVNVREGYNVVMARRADDFTLSSGSE